MVEETCPHIDAACLIRLLGLLRINVCFECVRGARRQACVWRGLGCLPAERRKGRESGQGTETGFRHCSWCWVVIARSVPFLRYATYSGTCVLSQPIFLPCIMFFFSGKLDPDGCIVVLYMCVWFCLNSLGPRIVEP